VKRFSPVAAALATFACAALSSPAAWGASLEVAPSAKSSTRAAHAHLCPCHRTARRHGARVRGPATYADWAYFDPCCRATGHPRPKGFCGGRDFYLGGVW